MQGFPFIAVLLSADWEELCVEKASLGILARNLNRRAVLGQHRATDGTREALGTVAPGHHPFFYPPHPSLPNPPPHPSFPDPDRESIPRGGGSVRPERSRRACPCEGRGSTERNGVGCPVPYLSKGEGWGEGEIPGPGRAPARLGFQLLPPMHLKSELENQDSALQFLLPLPLLGILTRSP